VTRAAKNTLKPCFKRGLIGEGVKGLIDEGMKGLRDEGIKET
jgi:hypothetical protein